MGKSVNLAVLTYPVSGVSAEDAFNELEVVYKVSGKPMGRCLDVRCGEDGLLADYSALTLDSDEDLIAKASSDFLDYVEFDGYNGIENHSLYVFINVSKRLIRG